MKIAKSDFENIVLLKSELRLLRRFSREEHVKLDQQKAYCLLQYGLITPCCICDSNSLKAKKLEYCISDVGLHYWAYLMQLKHDKIATRTIAIAALVLSLCSIAAQLVIALWQQSK